MRLEGKGDQGGLVEVEVEVGVSLGREPDITFVTIICITLPQICPHMSHKNAQFIQIHPQIGIMFSKKQMQKCED